MTTLHEAAQQALEALSPWSGEDANHTEQYAAYHAIREALAEQEQRWTEFNETTKKNIEHAEWYLSTHPAQQQEPFGHVTVRRLSQRFENHADQYWFFPAGQSPYRDNVDEIHAVYTSPPASKPAQQQEPVAVTDNTYNYAKNLAEAIFKQHFASDEHYASGRIVWGVNDTVIGILTQIDNMVADMVRRPAQQPEPCQCPECQVTPHASDCAVHNAPAYPIGKCDCGAQPEQEPVAWRNAALRVGEDLCSVGPFGYYDMTAKQWLDWALSVVTVHAPPASKPWVAAQEPRGLIDIGRIFRGEDK